MPVSLKQDDSASALAAAQTVRILLLEDDDVDAENIRRSFEFNRHASQFEFCWERSLAKGMRRLAEEKFAAVLLDLGLPDSPGGIDTLRELFSVDSEVPVVILTGIDNVESAIASVSAGAQDYLVKEEVDRNRIVQVLLYAIERKRFELEQQELKLVRSELETAREIQQSLFPKHSPDVEGYDIAGTCVPAARVGGDYFDFLVDADGQHLLVCADASGHGIPAALLATQIRSVLRTLSRYETKVDALVGSLDRLVAPDIPPHLFTTIAVAKLNPATNVVEYVCAGQDAILLAHDGRHKATLVPQAPPVNVMQDFDIIKCDRLMMMPGEILVMYTDGITEAGREQPYGVDRLLSYIRDHRHLSASEIVSGAIDDARTCCPDLSPPDDMTLVIVKRHLTV